MARRKEHRDVVPSGLLVHIPIPVSLPENTAFGVGGGFDGCSAESISAKGLLLFHRTGSTGASPLPHLLFLLQWHNWSQLSGPMMGVGQQQGPLSNALQFRWETGMDMLCRNPTGWQNSLQGEVTSRPAQGSKVIRGVPGPGSRVVQGRIDAPGHPTTTPDWSCHHCRGPGESSLNAACWR